MSVSIRQLVPLHTVLPQLCKLVSDSILLFLCELLIAVCLSAELMGAASLGQKECNPPGIQWKQLLCIPGTSRGHSHLVGDEG